MGGGLEEIGQRLSAKQVGNTVAGQHHQGGENSRGGRCLKARGADIDCDEMSEPRGLRARLGMLEYR
jgi:hypothetical protein